MTNFQEDEQGVPPVDVSAAAGPVVDPADTQVAALAVKKNHKRQWILGVILLVLLVGLVAWAWGRVQFDWQVFRQQVLHANWNLVLAGVGCIYAAYCLRAVRWALFLKPTRKTSPFAVLGSQLIGFTAVALLGRPADLVRPYLVARRLKLSLSSQIAVYVVERMFDLGAMALIFSCVMLAAHSQQLPHPEILKKIAAGGLLGTFGLAVFTVIVRSSGHWLATFVEKSLSGFMPNFAHSAGDKIRAFRSGLDTLSTGRDVLMAIVISIVHWILISAAYVLTLRAFSTAPVLGTITWAQSMVLMATSMLASGIQLPILGWFTQIGITSTAMHNLFNVPLEPALGAGALLLGVTFLSVVPAGLIWAQFESVSLRKVAEESEQAGEELEAVEENRTDRGSVTGLS